MYVAFKGKVISKSDRRCLLSVINNIVFYIMDKACLCVRLLRACVYESLTAL